MLNNYSRMQIAIAELGLDAGLISDKTGYSQGAVSKILNGKNELTCQFVKIFCYSFNISEEWLSTGQGEMRPIRSLVQEACDGLSEAELLELPEMLRMWKLGRK